MTSVLPDEALDADIAVLGRKGGGKTYTSKGIVERLLDMGRRVLILDPLGVWAGLRTAADGERPGYPVAIFGGNHADLPLDTAAAPAVAGIIARNNLPAVVDLSELSKSAQQSFLLAFLHELRRVNTEALTIVLEEADVFAPQQPMGDDSKALHGEIDWIARRGRFRGFRLITITQRPARLSKDVLTQCSTLIAHRLPAPQDRDAIKAWVDGNGDRDQSREVFDTLAGLAVGEAWVWAPEHEILSRMRFPRIKTLDTSATPKAGEKRIEPKTLADVDLTAIRDTLASAAAEQEQGSKRAGRAGEFSMVREAAKRAADECYARGLADGKAAAAREIFDRFVAYMSRPMTYDEVVSGLVSAEASRGAVAVTAENALTTVEAKPRPPQRGAADGTLRGAAVPLLQAFARYPGRGLTWGEACIVAGMISGNGYFYAGRKSLVEGGYVFADGGNPVLITEAGTKLTGGFGTPLTRKEIIDLWAGKATAPGPTLLAIISNHRGHWINTDDLAHAAAMKPGNGYWYKGIKALRTAGLIDQERGAFRLSAFLREAR